MSETGLLNARQLCKRLNISERTFYRQRPTGSFRIFEVKRPVGQFRYSSQLVDDFLAGRPANHYGRRMP